MSDSPAEPIEGHAGFAQAALQLARGARRELCLLSHELDRRLYGSEDFAAALKALLLGGERHRVRLLLNQSQEAAQRGCPRLAELAARLPSRMEIRQLAEEHLAEWQGDWLIADGRGLLQRRLPEALVATLHGDAPLAGRELLKQFDSLWDAGHPAAEFRRLGL